jgi:magnesium transporter
MAPPEPSSVEEPLHLDEVREGWSLFDLDERVEAFRLLPRHEAEDLFLDLPSADQAAILRALPSADRRSWIRLLAPDDAADLIQQVPLEERAGYVALLDEVTQKDVGGLLAFAEDDAGGLMNTRYARLRPEMSVDEAVTYLRKLARERSGPGTIYYTYVLDPESHLLGVCSFRELFAASSEKKVRDIMRTDLVKADETLDQEHLGRLFAEHDLVAIPVVDAENRMKGVVTVDDIVDVVQEEATEDIQKIGGTEALDAPYLRVPLLHMIRKRAGWLAILFVGEMFTATAMGYYEKEIQTLALLALFLPLIISGGGNSGSQATTLVIRAMALGEVRMRDWWRVIRREIASGVALGVILAGIAVARILLWYAFGWQSYDDVPARVALTVAFAVVGVVTWGTIVGSMLPFVLRKLGFDPASASAPFVATIVDVSGIVIYFTLAALFLLPYVAAHAHAVAR